MAQLLDFGAEVHPVENFPHGVPFLIQLAVVPLAVNVVADEPSHRGTRHYIAGEMLPRTHTRNYHR